MKATFYLQFKPTFSPLGTKGITGVKATRLTQERPSDPEGLVVKFEVEIPDDYLEPTIVARLDSVADTIVDLKTDIKDLS